MPEKKKRTWMWAGLPAKYGIECPKCHGFDIQWSEYEGHVWCYKCEIDFPGSRSLTDGPVGVGLLMSMGINLNKIDVASGKLLLITFNEDGSLYWKEKEDAGADHPE